MCRLSFVVIAVSAARKCYRGVSVIIIGIAQNTRLMTASEAIRDEVADHCEQYGTTQRQFDDFYDAAYSWKHRERRIIVKAEHTLKGANPRFIVTSLSGEPQPLYEHVYCAIWKIALENNSLICSLTVPVAQNGGRINFG
jgi:hypothetical protein